MKKLLFVAAIAAFSFTSCTKDLTCTCTTASTGNTHTDVYTYKGVKKSDAALMCDSKTSSDTYVGATTSTTTCELK